MTATATGSFTVEMTPQGEGATSDGVSTGRMALAKRFAGDLEGTGAGEMLTALTPVAGSAGYVAIERFTGSVHGRAGSFVFQHAGVMSGGAKRLAIEVVPYSGTGALAGIAGTFAIEIVEGRHTYAFDYRLPEGAGAAG